MNSSIQSFLEQTIYLLAIIKLFQIDFKLSTYMDTRFTASESIEISVEEQEVPIEQYLRQTQRIVKTIANPDLMTQLSEGRYELKMRPLDFLDIYHFQPIVILHVWSDQDGTVHIQSEDCEIKGIEKKINQQFALEVTGKLFPAQKAAKTYLQGKADAQIKVELPEPLRLTPKPFLQATGNGLLENVLQRIKRRIEKELVKDYRQWASSHAKTQNSVV